ncbi:hypothetical protein KR026_000361 [Drosophila bipectinata]|nr:hypothetical protein KR026_000361 [Drosophila bipectinata]
MECSEDEEQEQPKLKLMDLPINIIQSIISKVDYHHQKYLRNVSQDLRELHTDHMLRHHQIFVRAHQAKSEESEEALRASTMLETLAYAISIYRSLGFENYFVNSLMHFYEDLKVKYREADGDPQSQHMTRFIKQFLNSLERPYLHGVPANKTQQFYELRLLYTLSLFKIVRKFREFRITSWRMNLMHWHLQIEVKSMFFGVIMQRRSEPPDQVKRNDFMAMMAELLYYDTQRRRFTGFKDAGNVIYTYGLRPDPATRHSYMVLKFVVLAPKRILRILQNAITGKCDTLSPNSIPPCSAFSMRLEAYSKPGNRFNSLPIKISVLETTDTA